MAAASDTSASFSKAVSIAAEALSPAERAAASTASRWVSTAVAASSWVVASSKRQSRIASRMLAGRRQSPAAVTTASYLARAAARASSSGRSVSRATQVRQRSSYLAGVRASRRSSSPRQSGGPATSSGETGPAVAGGWYAPTCAAASAQTARSPSGPARSAIACASVSVAA